jgi:probable rRNA maturation factor
MSIAVYVSSQGVRAGLAPARVQALARAALASEKVRDAMLSVTFVSNSAIARLNAGHLGHRGATDVISFGFTGSGKRAPIIGDIYIAPAVARTNAIENGVPIRVELARLVVHGTLHVLGFDHPEADARTRSPMWKRQERILARVMATA